VAWRAEPGNFERDREEILGTQRAQSSNTEFTEPNTPSAAGEAGTFQIFRTDEQDGRDKEVAGRNRNDMRRDGLSQNPSCKIRFILSPFPLGS
jgi:hypothetical protein